MSANRIAFENSVVATGTVARVAQATNMTVEQGIAAAGTSSAGFVPGFPAGFAAAQAAITAAAAQKVIDAANVEQTRQAAIANARDLLRTQGEIPS